ncbi:MAG: GGDEF domain-containing protein [Butyrivibrio sp.]|uniref:GGDEF domain-containing protein n=1 Tax=Butyrivibrio sp. TaxID=28121 RepID=UPI0025B9A9C3|nr:GGDEF domain-containing protein [Butyrivibrio sp.]MBQ6588417.1 GGDEF domain-containing protein [Butyrivibrio sp.]
MKSDYPDKSKRSRIYGSIIIYKIVSMVIVIMLTVVMTFTFFVERSQFENLEGAPAPTIFIIMGFCILFFLISIIIDFYILHRTISIGKKLNRLAYIDKLTGIPNRYSCDLLFDNFNSPELLPGAGFLLLKINNLVAINKDKSHNNGNFLIAEFSSILEDVSQEYGYVGRNGGNEFVVMMENCDSTKLEMFLMDLTKRIHGYNEMNVGDPLEIAYSKALNHDEHKEKISELISLGYKRLRAVPQILS